MVRNHSTSGALGRLAKDSRPFRVLIERRRQLGVQEKMARVKKVVVWLIPVLWLVASVECLSDLVSFAPQEPASSALSSDQCGHREPIFVCSLEQSARRLGRRLDLESGPEKRQPAGAMFERNHSLSAQRAFSSARFQHALELTQSWQFLWRTAVEPRAPSVS
jgi:hypothetical protein